MQSVLARELKRVGFTTDEPPRDAEGWSAFIGTMDRVLSQADNDRDLLERSLSLSSEEMAELHEQLESERDAVRHTICSLVEGVCAVDEAGRVISVNPQAIRFLGLVRMEDAIGRALSDITEAKLPDGRCLTDALALSAQELEELGVFRLELHRDCPLRIMCTITQLAESGGGHVITLRDVTDQAKDAEQLAKLNRQLLDASHRAGMAEVATCVLHNVGNVLNSVNVSGSVIHQKLLDSEVVTLQKLAEMIPSDPEALGAYFTNDERGRHVPALIDGIANQLTQERCVILDEVNSLVKNINHIRDVVASQQSNASAGKLIETIDIREAVDEALRINEASVERHDLTVSLEFGETPRVTVDRHKLLQILVNLISNAKNACVGSGADDRRINISIALRVRAGAEMVCVEVRDNGSGIAKENMERIFEHGFTTRDDGHGFGLHYCALAARTLGGDLAASSDGEGQGATFTLTIPCECIDNAECMGAAA